MRPTGVVQVLGLDGCPGGWVVATVTSASASARTVDVEVADLGRVLSLARGARVVGIDMPMGLLQTGSRVCDVEARRLLGPVRGSSVFPAPTRAWLSATDYRDALRLARASGGAGLSRQAFNILGKVRDVDGALRRDAAFLRKAREVHPEVSFTLLNGGSVIASKKTAAGRAMRRQLLGRAFGRGTITRLCRRHLPGCGEDDVLDAVSVAWSAWRIAEGRALALPGAALRDAHGIPMRIWA